MQAPGQDLFRALLRVSTGTVKPMFVDSGVILEWDLANQELRANIRIPIETKVSNETGEYIITSQDFVSDRLPPSSNT